MGDLNEKVLEVLCRHFSPIHARPLLGRALRTCGLEGANLRATDVPNVAARLERSALLFLDRDGQARLRKDLEELQQGDVQRQPLRTERIDIEAERDISEVRSRARDLCLSLGGAAMTSQKLATLVSELARNIVLYTPGGHIELHPDPKTPAVFVRAVDRGPGIPNLDDIMSGRYRSRTGLGCGLRGSKRLADTFDVKTGADGTRVEAKVSL